MNKNLFLVFCISFLLVFTLSPIVSADKIEQTTILASQGLEIEAPNFNFLQKEQYHIFRFRVYNVTNDVYMNDDQVNCDIGIINNLGEDIFNKMDVIENEYVFSVNVSGGNFSEEGIYHEGINCITNDGTTAGDVRTISFEVTPNGKETPSGLVITFFSLLFILVVVTMLTLLMNLIFRMISWDFDARDLIFNVSAYFGIFVIHILSKQYLGNSFINEFLVWIIGIGGFTMVFLPLIAFFLTIVKGNLKSNE